ncbi:FecR family protein [Olivibacter domesticus]|uniref:FecR family protein n=1 Tax=Olivibacter domesticus TaxID=407022 RepID=A0A1H7R3Y2_OLID1|nr:FecR family protein [Olivibacter domesticus]SEL54941.1 FecR family protein [Olivibacter domesticus]
MDKDTFYRNLIRRYRDGLATDEELEVFAQLLRSGEIDAHLAESMDQQLYSGQGKKRTFRLTYTYAAAFILFCILGYIVFYYQRQGHYAAPATIAGDIHAASNQAILTLADGRRVKLDATVNRISESGGIQILNDKDGKISYYINPERETAELYHEISIPKGGKYQLALADGTMVWLNADTRLKFPVQFNEKQREVELVGEAYFEVKQPVDKRKGDSPFIVHTREQNIVVLGTSFNVKAYTEEINEVSTLVTGRVKVMNSKTKQSKLLEPGQQSIINGTKPDIAIAEADMEETLAWKNGDFVFNETSIREIMNQLGRWYNVEVEFNGVKNYSYNGYIPRNVSLLKVLEMMERTGELKFEINNKKIYIKNKMPM